MRELGGIGGKFSINRMMIRGRGHSWKSMEGGGEGWAEAVDRIGRGRLSRWTFRETNGHSKYVQALDL